MAVHPTGCSIILAGTPIKTIYLSYDNTIRREAAHHCDTIRRSRNVKRPNPETKYASRMTLHKACFTR